MRDDDWHDDDDDDGGYDGPYPDNPPPPRPPPPTDGQLYRYHAYAHCDGCRTKWRRLVECRYRVDHTRRDFLGGPMIHGERVRDLTGWEKAPDAGSSFALWLTVEDGARGGCPTCSAAAAQMTLDGPAAAYTPDQAGHYDNPPRPYSGPVTEEDALAALVPAGFVEQLDTRAGTGQVVEQLKAAGVTRPPGAPWNWNRLANLCTFAALDARRDTEPRPGEQLTLA